MVVDLMKIFSNRKTSRLVETNDIPAQDIDLIKAAILTAPSLDKRFPYKVFFLTNSETGIAHKKQLLEYFRCGNDKVGDPWEGKEMLQPILSGLTIVFVQNPTPLIVNNHSFGELELIAGRDIAIAGTLAMLTGEALGYATGMFGACTDPVGAAATLGCTTANEKVRFVVTVATKDIGIKTMFDNIDNLTIVNKDEHKVYFDYNNERPFSFVVKHRTFPTTTQISTF